MSGGGHRRSGPVTLPDKAIWYLATNLPRPGGPSQADSVYPAADLAEIVACWVFRRRPRPPPDLQTLINTVGAGRGLNL